jgi:hypothetical protein
VGRCAFGREGRKEDVGRVEDEVRGRRRASNASKQVSK